MPKLLVVGSGIKSVAHLTEETKRVIQSAEKVLYLVHEETLKQWIEREAKQSESLDSLYFSTEKRIDAYKLITDYILEQYSKTKNLCVVMYGHPCVFASSALNAVKAIKSQNGQAVILPAVSAMDCLFSDLQIDPGEQGCFSVDATELLIYERPIDPYAHLVLWQVANLGTHDRQETQKITILQDYLLQFYPANHPVCLYEAAILPTQAPRLIWVDLTNFKDREITLSSTVYLPPKHHSMLSEKYLSLLGMELKNFKSDN